jgi:hypothetical protein
VSILGCGTPRIFTPPRRELTPETTHGFACIAFAEEVLEIKLFPWQKWLLLHALELDESGLYRFRTVVVEVARQNGKSLVMVVLALWHIYALDSRKVIATAQDLSRAEESWEDAVEWAMSNDELEPLIAGTGDKDREGIKRGHPKRLILDNKCEYRVASASRRGGRGFSGDLILLDELQEHQSWDSWAAVTKTAMARPRAQAWAFANAGDSLSVVLRHLRAKAHRNLGWPDGDSDAEMLDEPDPAVAALLEIVGQVATGFFEWSAPPGALRTDMAALAQANPAMNHTEVVADCVTDRALVHALAEDPPMVFDKECMCRWVAHSDGGPFPEGTWAKTLDNEARPAEGAKSSVCVEVSDSTRNRERTFIARAAADDDGNPVAGIWEDQLGSDWVVPWLQEHREGYSVIVLRSGAGTPALSLLDEIEAAELPLEKWSAADVSAAHGQVFDAVRDGQIKHLAHPGLDSAATSAAIKVQAGGGWIVDPKNSPTDTAPLIAVMGATWGLAHIEEKPVPRVHGWDQDKIAEWEKQLT